MVCEYTKCLPETASVFVPLLPDADAVTAVFVHPAQRQYKPMQTHTHAHVHIHIHVYTLNTVSTDLT